MIALKKDNFFKTTLDSGISDSAASMTLQSGDAARLSSDGPYRMVLWGAAYTNPSDDANAEIVEATKGTGEAFDIVRAREGTTARSWSADDNVALTATAGTWDEVERTLKEFALVNLTEQAQSIFSSGIYAVAHGGGVWVAVGNSGKLATSPDGITWTGRTSSFGSSDIHGVAYDGSGRWVAVGDSGKLATSDDDGATWTQRTSGGGANDNLYGVAHDGAGLWVAVGGYLISNFIITSSDGITWTERTGGFTGKLYTVAHDGSGLWTTAGTGGKLATSSDGITWTQRTSQFGTSDINGVCHNGSRWVAVGDGGKISTSSDGTTWTARTSGLTGSLLGVAAGYNGMLAAAGLYGKVTVSHNATDWAELMVDLDFATDELITGIAWDGYKWVMVSISDKILGSLRLP